MSLVCVRARVRACVRGGHHHRRWTGGVRESICVTQSRRPSQIRPWHINCMVGAKSGHISSYGRVLPGRPGLVQCPGCSFVGTDICLLG